MRVLAAIAVGLVLAGCGTLSKPPLVASVSTRAEWSSSPGIPLDVTVTLSNPSTNTVNVDPSTWRLIDSQGRTFDVDQSRAKDLISQAQIFPGVDKTLSVPFTIPGDSADVRFVGEHFPPTPLPGDPAGSADRPGMTMTTFLSRSKGEEKMRIAADGRIWSNRWELLLDSGGTAGLVGGLTVSVWQSEREITRFPVIEGSWQPDERNPDFYRVDGESETRRFPIIEGRWLPVEGEPGLYRVVVEWQDTWGHRESREPYRDRPYLRLLISVRQLPPSGS